MPDGRYLKEHDIKHIKKLANKLFNFNQKKASLIFAQNLFKEYINLESATNFFNEVNGDIDTLKSVYHEFITTNDSISSILVESGTEQEEAFMIEDEILKRISVPKHFNTLSEKLEDNVYLVIDSEKKETFKEVISYTRKGDENYNDIKLIDASLKELTVYDNPVAEETRQFKSLWDTNLKPYPLQIGPDTAPDIAAQLSESGYIIRKRDGEDAVKVCFNIFIKRGLAELKSEIDTPGFYFSEGSKTLQNIKYEVIEEVSKKDLQKGLNTLHEFAEWFSNQKTALATVLKWGLISPFIFAMKQKGGWVRWPFLYGNAGTGKSTLGKMVLYLWDEPDNKTNNIPGSGFDNEARIGDRL